MREPVLKVSLKCFLSIYIYFMFLEFWLNLFLKIRESENVFLAQNGKEIGENERFWPKMGEIGGILTQKCLRTISSVRYVLCISIRCIITNF